MTRLFLRTVALVGQIAAVWLSIAPLRPATAALNAVCSFAGPTLSLGVLSPFSGFPASTSGTVGISCTNPNPTAVTVHFCLSVSAGPTTLLAPGSMSQLAVQVNGGASWPGAIGDGTSLPMEGPITIGIGGGSTYTGSLPLAIKLLSPGFIPQPGIYASIFLPTDSQIFYTTSASAPLSCSTLLAGAHSTAPAGFSVAVTIDTQCTVAASSLAFPTRSLLTTAAIATATVTTTCNAAVPVAVALDLGATGTGPTARVMRSSSGAITYGIYRDPGFTQPWGSAAGTTATIGTGSGTLTAYGQVPPQASVPPGSYADVVNVIISY